MADRLYEAAVQPALWRETCNELALVLRSQSVAVFSFPEMESIGAVWSRDLDELVEWLLTEVGPSRNARAARALSLPTSTQVLTVEDIFAPHELETIPFNREMIHRFGVRYEAGALFERMGRSALLFTIQRGERHGPFSDADKTAFRALVRHLRSAVRAGIELASARAAGVLEAYASLGCASVLLGFDGRVRRMNALAEGLLGNGINFCNGRLFAMDRRSDAHLQALISCLLGPASRENARTYAIVHRPETRPLIVNGIPVRRSAEEVFAETGAILFFTDPGGRRRPPCAILSEAFQLTKAESRLAAALAQGTDLKAFAEQNEVSLATARAQLRSVFNKTDTHRQAELVALLARIAALNDC